MSDCTQRIGIYLINKNSQITELVGVYDADGTIMGEVAYWVGARLGVRHCSLCDITHSLFRVKPSWLEVANKLKIQSGILFKAYHRNDQPADVRAVIAGRYPAIIARNANNELHLFMSDVEITNCGKSPEAFLAAITKKISQ